MKKIKPEIKNREGNTFLRMSSDLLRRRRLREVGRGVLLFTALFTALYFFDYQQIQMLFFRRPVPISIRPEVAHVNCQRLLNNDSSYARLISHNRLKLVENPNLSMKCSDIRARIVTGLNPDRGYPVLFLKNVYRDYEFLEEQLALSYAEENTYCFHVDSKSPVDFYNKLRCVSKCIPNVIVSYRRYNVDSSGHYQNDAYFHCLNMTRSRPWNYAVFMQNHDVLLRTDDELKRVLRIMNGTNDVLFNNCPKHRCNENIDRNLAHMGLCPRQFAPEKATMCANSSLEWGKGSIQSMVSRETLDYILDNMDLTPSLAQFNKFGYAYDEIYMPSLLSTEALEIPGRFTSGAKPRGNTYISRFVEWILIMKKCRSVHDRHGVCLLGVEYLPILANSEKIVANKVMPEFDYTAVACLNQLLQRRVLGYEESPLNEQFYRQLPQVREHYEQMTTTTSTHVIPPEW